MRDVSDELCYKYRLSVLEHAARHGRSRAEWQAEKNGEPTWMTPIRMDLDAAIMGAVHFQEFVKNMRERGYEVEKRGSLWRIKPPNHDRFSRLRRFGENYTEDAIIQRIIRQRWPSKPPRPEEQKTIRRAKVYGDFHLSKITFKGLRALYFFYRRKLQAAYRQQSSYTPYVLREDLRYLDAIDRQTRFIFKHKIDDEEQLSGYKSFAEEQIAKLLSERNELKNEMRHIDIPEQRTVEIKKRLSDITKELKPLRQDIKLCEAIVVRSLIIAEKNAQLKQVEEKEVEKQRDKTHKRTITR